MIVARRCWWCGAEADVDTILPEDNSLVRDDSSFDGGDLETWICIDNRACNERANTGRFGAVKGRSD